MALGNTTTPDQATEQMQQSQQASQDTQQSQTPKSDQSQQQDSQQPQPAANGQQPPTPPSNGTPTQSPQDQPGPNGQQPGQMPKQGPQQSAPGAPPAQPEQHPAIQKAGLLHSIAETLAGGPQFQTTIDPNTGQATRTQVPLSGRQIGLAIALEAISGSLTGLGAKGPNAAGQAAGMGFAQGEKAGQERLAAQQQQEQQAQQDFTRHYQVFETNLRLLQNAQTVGRQDYDVNNAYVGQFKPMAEMIQAQHPEVVKGIIDESDMPKYHVTKDSAIPYSVSKRIDPKTGEQIKDHNGVPQWDIQYMVIDPNFKADNFLSDDDRAIAHKFRLPGFADGDGNPTKLPQSLPMRLSMALNYKARIASLRLADQDVNHFYDSMNKSVEGGDVPLTMPQMRDQATQSLVDEAASKYGVPQALARAVAMQESGGKSDAVSPKGAQGIMQLMPDTAKSLGVSNPLDPQQNIDGGVRYLKQLLDKYDGNTKLALAAYNAGPGKVTDSVPNFPETQNYVKSISKAIGLDNPQAPKPGEKEAYPKVDLVDAVQKDPTLVDALEKFQPLLNASQQNYQKAIGALGAKDPQAAGKILQLYGGTDLVGHYDMMRANAIDAAKKRTENNELLSRQAQERADKAAENEQSYLDDARSIAGDPNDPGSGDMMALDKLISQRTADRPKVYALAKKINPNFNPANAELKLQTWKDFATDQGKASQQIKSFNTLFDHIGGALDASAKFRNTSLGTAINEPMNKFRSKLEGDPNFSALVASIQPVKSEFMTFLNNNHALTEHDKQAGDDILNWNMSPAVLEGNLKKFAETAAYRLKETNTQFKRVFGTNAPGLISEDALKTVRAVPEVANIVGDMDTGGTFLGSSNGRGTLGRTVNEAIGRSTPKIPQGVRPAQSGEQPVWTANGQFLGYTSDGKSFSYQYKQGM